MVRHRTKSFSVPNSLDPEKILPKFIRRVDVFTWEAALKGLLMKWMDDSESPFEKVMEDLGGSLYESSEEKNDALHHSNAAGMREGVETVDFGDLTSSTMPLLERLHERNALPAILFNYDRFACEKIAKSVLSKLQTAEKKYKETSLDWKKLMEGFEKWQETEEAKKTKRGPKILAKKKKKR